MLESGILGLVILALLVERYLSSRAHDNEVIRLTQAVIAKNAGEVRMMDEFWVKEAPIKEPVDRRPLPTPEELEGYEGQAGLS